MLHYEPSVNRELLEGLAARALGGGFPYAVGYILYNDSEPVGIARVEAAADVSRLVAVGIVPEQRGRGFGDFFTRVLLDVMSRVSAEVRVDYLSDYFLRFGFLSDENGMIIDAKSIIFPSLCQKH